MQVLFDRGSGHASKYILACAILQAPPMYKLQGKISTLGGGGGGGGGPLTPPHRHLNNLKTLALLLALASRFNEFPLLLLRFNLLKVIVIQPWVVLKHTSLPS